MAISDKGFAFPFRISDAEGGVIWAEGAEKVRQSVRVLLGTRLGERPMIRDYGTRIHALVHDPNDDVVSDLVQSQVQQALLKWEGRVLITGTTVEQDEGELRLRLEYLHTNAPVTGRMLVPIR